jgi:hypothetical protein
VVKAIKISKGMEVIVDDDDYDALSKYKWFYSTTGYAARTVYLGRENGKEIKKNVKMHREILSAAPSSIVDHIDGNPLNNTRSNLRIATPAENVRNKRKNGTKKTKYKGVYLRPENGTWRVKIEKNGKQYNIGHFSSEREAAIAYNKAALEMFGEFAKLNEVHDE